MISRRKLLSYEAILDELGENLIKANSGKEALEQLLKNDIAVVLMDVSMPEIDGFELAGNDPPASALSEARRSFSFRPCISPISIASKATSAAPWITFPFPWSRNCCARKSASLPNCIARRSNSKCLNQRTAPSFGTA